jgi:hypothetical protein
VDYARVFWLAFGVFGATALLTTLANVAGEGGDAISWATMIASGGVVVVALAGLRDPESSGAPREPGPLLYLVVLGTTLYVASVAIRHLS